MTAMRPLALNHQAPRRTASPRALNALVLLALACNVACGLYYEELAGRRQALLAPPPSPSPAARRGPDLQAELRRAGDSVRALSLPWSDVFGAIEGAGSADVSLLAIDPMPDKRVVKLHAEARNMDAVLAYLRALSGSAALASVSLQSHQVQQGDPQHPVRFLVLLEWRAPS